jgi:hypothetical protein
VRHTWCAREASWGLCFAGGRCSDASLSSYVSLAEADTVSGIVVSGNLQISQVWGSCWSVRACCGSWEDFSGPDCNRAVEEAPFEESSSDGNTRLR